MINRLTLIGHHEILHKLLSVHKDIGNYLRFASKIRLISSNYQHTILWDFKVDFRTYGLAAPLLSNVVSRNEQLLFRDASQCQCNAYSVSSFKILFRERKPDRLNSMKTDHYSKRKDTKFLKSNDYNLL